MNTPEPSTEKYWIIKNVLSADTCELIAEYARFKANLKPQSRKNDDPLAGIHREYGDILMETLLLRLTPKIEHTTGLALWPTLSFLYTYKNGNQLLPHKDRSSCEIVAGLCIGADEDFKNTVGSWPLILGINEKTEPVFLQNGDMVIFKGHDTRHWREPFTGQWFVSAIFGYVDKNGPFAFQKYDQRKMPGTPHAGMFKWLYGCLKAALQKKLKKKPS